MENKISISILEEFKDDNDLKQISSIYKNVEISFHKELPYGIGGDFNSFYGLLIGFIGGQLIQNIFTDLYQLVKNKLYLIYKKINNSKKIKSKVMNLVFKEEINVYMFIFDFDLDEKEYDDRYERLKKQYPSLTNINKNKINYPFVFFWNQYRGEWEVLKSNLD